MDLWTYRHENLPCTDFNTKIGLSLKHQEPLIKKLDQIVRKNMFF